MSDREIDFEKVTFAQIAETVDTIKDRVELAATSKEEYNAIMIGSLLGLIYILTNKLASMEKENQYEA